MAALRWLAASLWGGGLTVNSSPSSRAAFIAGGILLLILGGAIVFVAGILWNYVATLPPAQGVTLLAAAVAAVISLFGLYVNRRADRTREIEASLRPRKAEVYEEFVRFWLGALLGMKEGKVNVSPDQMMEFFTSFTQKVVVWGSDDVISKNRQFRPVSMSGTGLQTLLQFEQLLFAIRRDLGHHNAGLARGDLLGLWVNDIDEVLKKAGTSQT
jgi:hypothetical protein